MVTEETPIREQVDDYIGREFYSKEDLEGLPPCIVANCHGALLLHNLNGVGVGGDWPPYRVTHLIEAYEVPAPKSHAPELELEAARRFTFNVRSSLSEGHVSLLTLESPYGKWWYATLESSLHSSLHLSGEDTEPWQYSGRPSQFATAEEALAAAWATPEIKGLA